MQVNNILIISFKEQTMLFEVEFADVELCRHVGLSLKFTMHSFQVYVHVYCSNCICVCLLFLVCLFVCVFC